MRYPFDATFRPLRLGRQEIPFVSCGISLELWPGPGWPKAVSHFHAKSVRNPLRTGEKVPAASFRGLFDQVICAIIRKT